MNPQKKTKKKVSKRSQSAANPKKSKGVIASKGKGVLPEPQPVLKPETELVVPTPAQSPISAATEPPQEPRIVSKGPIRRRTRPASRAVSLKIPPILLETDTPRVPTSSGPGERYSLGPVPSVPPTPSDRPQGLAAWPEPLRELPESYGTEQLWLTARDPHWLYASWDIGQKRQKYYNERSVDGHLVLRAYVEVVEGNPAAEVHLHPESSHWFLHVDRAETKYIGELGYWGRDGKWYTIGISSPTLTPPDQASKETVVQFATIPPQVTSEQLLVAVTAAVQESVPLKEAFQQLSQPEEQKHVPAPRADAISRQPEDPIPSHIQPPEVSAASIHVEMQTAAPTPASSLKEKSAQRRTVAAAPTKKWTLAQARALAELLTIDTVRRVWVGSLEVTELVRRHLQPEVSSLSLIEMSESAPLPPEAAAVAEALGIFSPIGQPPKGDVERKGFWFNLNAELVIYGATEADASVVIGSRKIKLRPDGTFSYRFALPDGQYPLEITATSADGQDARSAKLDFGRSTQYSGEIKAHPQDPQLKVPSEAHVS